MPLMTQTIPCKGGLNFAATDEELLTLPNDAIELINMESSKNGGYRRINGFTEFPGTSLSGIGSGEVKGIMEYLGGILVAKGTGLYHSFSGSVWTQVNTDAAAGSNNATVVGATPIALSTSDEVQLQMSTYTDATGEHVYIATGNGNPLYLLITGTSEVGAAYTFREITEGTVLNKAKWCTVFQDQNVLANSEDYPTSLFYSSFPTTDITVADGPMTPREKFSGSTSGEIGFKRPITGIAEHRDVLYVFTDRTINKIVGMREGNPNNVPITDNVGCLDGNTIQEIGGDLVFLSHDGLRTISQTERIDDVELGVISRKIAPITDYITRNINNITFSSVVIREKNQYRLWYRDSAQTLEDQKGIIAAYAYDSQTGGFRWDYSEMQGWEPTAVAGGKTSTGTEFYISGDSTGKVYCLEAGSDFDGTVIPWLYQTPFTDMGDIGIRKNIHDVFLRMKTEGTVEAQLSIKYDYEGEDVHQPIGYSLGEIVTGGVYGEAVYGSAVYGAYSPDNQKIYTEGSGFTVSFRVSDLGMADDPFTFESLKINFTPSGRI